ncbi:MAG: hypothetical protein Q9199_006013 [Rusavskia elegans]
MDDIPVKLRCAACNRLATNAFRTPCCDQSICESCQSSLPQACPICLHEPVKADDCRPNKTLRMTIKAFLKKIATEREKAQKKQSSEKVAANPASTTADSSERPPSTGPNTTSAAQPIHERDAAQASQEAPKSPDHSKPSINGETVPTEAQMDVPQPSIEATEDRVREDSFQEQAQGDGTTMNQSTQNDSQQPQNQHGMQMQGMNGGNLGFDGMNNRFPNMAFNNPADFNAMMQFMPNNAMGAFPNMIGMSGLPGMGMDPMQAMSQGMFGGLGGQNMGMNGMNGMNAGMGFPTGQGWNNGGFNGQPGAWMSGQDKFNQNAYGGGHANGMMGGDFGANAGYAGYNMPSHQGNFNQMNHHQFPNHDFQSNGYHGQGFHNRGRGGRGRGYGNPPRGRGGYNQVMNGNQTNHEPFHHQHPQQFDHGGNSFPQHSQQSQGNVRQNDTENPDVDGFGRIKRPQEEATDEQIARQMAPGDADESPEAPETAAPAEGPAPATAKDERSSEAVDDPAPTTDSTQPNPQDSKDQPLEKEKPAPIKTFISDEPPEAEPIAPNSTTAANTMMPPPGPAISQPPFSAASSEAPYEYGYRAAHQQNLAPPPGTDPIITVPTAIAPPAPPQQAQTAKNAVVNVTVDDPANTKMKMNNRRDRDDDRDEEDHSKEHRSHRSRRDRDRDRDRDREANSTRKRSRTPAAAAVEDANGVVETTLHSSSSSRKRHERHDEEDEARRERKRSRREHHKSNNDRSTTNPTERSSVKHNDSHGSSSKREDRNTIPSTAIKPPTGPKSHQKHQHSPQQPEAQQPQPPVTSKIDIDPHELERQARNKERLQKELQRREAMEGYKVAPTMKQRRESKTHGSGAGRRVV